MAKFLGVHESLVSKWKNVFNGTIPMRYFKPLLAEAKRRNKKLTPKDLIYGTKRITK